MLDELLQLGACLDWISPLLAIAQNLANGPSETLMFPVTCGWTGSEIAKLLHQHGIKTWGHMVVNDYYMINIRQSQSRWAHYVLQRSGFGESAT